MIKFVTITIVTGLLTTTTSAQTPPFISAFPGITNHFRLLEEGVSIVLDCPLKATGTNAEVKVTWFKDGNPVIEGNTLRLDSPNVNSDSGFYHCEAKNDLGLAKSEVLLISPTEPQFPEYDIRPEFTIQPETEFKEIGSEETFKCAARGSPEPDIIWTKNGQEVARNQEYLRFDQIDEDSVGTYACNASNSAGYVYKMFLLSILNQAPFFVETPRRRQAAIGQEIFLRCHAKGYPKPKISWTFNGSPIDLDGDDNLDQDPRGDLIIRRVNENSAGKYECQAQNEMGSKTIEGQLDVVSTTTIEEGPKDMAAQIGEAVEMKCAVLWDPAFALTIVWMKDGAQIDTTSRSSRFSKTPTNSLSIRDLKFEDAGIYTCVASTSQGSTTDSGTLTVTGIPPKLKFGPSRQVVTEGSTVELLCQVDAYPKPRHVWFKNVDRVNLTDPRLSVDDMGTLRIEDARQEDSDKYVCRAENGYGPPVIESAFVDVRQATKVVKKAESQAFVVGQNYSLDCLVEADPRLTDSVNVTWFKGGVAIDLTDNERLYVDDNNTLHLFEATSDDIDEYVCAVRTPVDEVVVKASIYNDEFDLWWLIILLIVLLIILIVLCCCFICMMRKRSKKKGRYGVKDVADGKSDPRNKSDIHFSIDEEGDGIDNDLLKDQDSMEPIFKPGGKAKSGSKTGDSGLLLDDAAAMGGSENSLLNLTDEEMWLRKGMDEDGSFREGRYAE